jgi:hypothetical protein
MLPIAPPAHKVKLHPCADLSVIRQRGRDAALGFALL